MRLYFRPVCPRTCFVLGQPQMTGRVLMGSSLGSVFRIDRHHHHFDQKSTNRTENKQIKVAPAQPPLPLNLLPSTSSSTLSFRHRQQLSRNTYAYLLIPDD